jgi:putative transposase
MWVVGESLNVQLPVSKVVTKLDCRSSRLDGIFLFCHSRESGNPEVLYNKIVRRGRSFCNIKKSSLDHRDTIFDNRQTNRGERRSPLQKDVLRMHGARHHRRSIRLRDYDYSQAGYYYVTICTQDRVCRFGRVRGEHVYLNRMRLVVKRWWAWFPRQYPYVILDSGVIMPNHLHEIVVIANENVCRGGLRTAPTPVLPSRKALGRLIGAFKTVSTKEINKIMRIPGRRIWQRSFYEHVIRNEAELNSRREYIMNNPLKWELDRNNPANW